MRADRQVRSAGAEVVQGWEPERVLTRGDARRKLSSSEQE